MSYWEFLTGDFLVTLFYVVDVPQNGAINFKIMIEAGVLPDEWSEPRQRKQRGSKIGSIPNTIPEETAAILAASIRVGGYADAETVAALAEEDAEQVECIETPASEELAYNVTGERRKAPVAAVANYTGEQAVYQNALTFACHIGQYAIDKNGLLTDLIDNELIQWLADEGFTTEEQEKALRAGGPQSFCFSSTSAYSERSV